MINMAGDIIGAFIRWLARRCKTRFRDELDCVDGWFTNVPILGKMLTSEELGEWYMGTLFASFATFL